MVRIGGPQLKTLTKGRILSELLIIPFHPLRHLVGFFVCIIDLSRIGVGRRVGGGTYPPTSILLLPPPFPPSYFLSDGTFIMDYIMIMK